MEHSVEAAKTPRDPETSQDSLISMLAAAKRLGVSYPKIKTMVYRGELRSVTIGRRRLIAESTLQEFIRGLLHPQRERCA